MEKKNTNGDKDKRKAHHLKVHYAKEKELEDFMAQLKSEPNWAEEEIERCRKGIYRDIGGGPLNVDGHLDWDGDGVEGSGEVVGVNGDEAVEELQEVLVGVNRRLKEMGVIRVEGREGVMAEGRDEEIEDGKDLPSVHDNHLVQEEVSDEVSD